MSEGWVNLETVEALDELPTGQYAYDAMGDPWVKQQDGNWEMYAENEKATLSAKDLLYVWGPIRAKLPDGYPAQEELKDRLNSQLKGRNPGAPINWRGL